MARAYDVRVAALTVQVSPKWLDNLLSHHELPGVERTRQGIERRINDDGLLAIELTRVLARDVGLTLADASHLARAALETRTGHGASSIAIAPGVELRVDIPALHERLRARLADAILAAPTIARGRPPKHAQNRTPDA